MGAAATTLTKDQQVIISKQMKGSFEKYLAEGLAEEEMRKKLTDDYNKEISELLTEPPVLPALKTTKKKPNQITRRRSFDGKPPPKHLPVQHSTIKAEKDQDNTTKAAPIDHTVVADGTITPVVGAEVDSWESVRSQPSCPICKMIFATATKLETHLKYSEVHIKNVQAIKENEERERRLSHPIVETEIIPEAPGSRCNELYSGSKLFWRTQDNINIDIYLHKLEQIVEIIPYNAHTNISYPRIYLDQNKVIGLLGGEAAVMLHVEQTKNKLALEIDDYSYNLKAIPSDDVLIAEEKRLLVSSHIMSKLVQVGDVLEYSFNAAIVLNDPNATNSSTPCPVDSHVHALPSTLKPVLIARRRLSTTEEISSALNDVHAMNQDLEVRRKAAEELEDKVKMALSHSDSIV